MKDSEMNTTQRMVAVMLIICCGMLAGMCYLAWHQKNTIVEIKVDRIYSTSMPSITITNE